MELRLSIFALARSRRIEAQQGRERTKRVVRTKRKPHSVIGQFGPRIRMRRTSIAQPSIYPMHVSQQVARLHRGNYIQFTKARDLRRICNLHMLNSKAIVSIPGAPRPCLADVWRDWAG